MDGDDVGVREGGQGAGLDRIGALEHDGAAELLVVGEQHPAPALGDGRLLHPESRAEPVCGLFVHHPPPRGPGGRVVTCGRPDGPRE